MTYRIVDATGQELGTTSELEIRTMLDGRTWLAAHLDDGRTVTGHIAHMTDRPNGMIDVYVNAPTFS